MKDVINQYAIQACLFEYLSDTDELTAVIQPTELLEHLESLENEEDKKYIRELNLTEDMNPLLYVIKTK